MRTDDLDPQAVAGLIFIGIGILIALGLVALVWWMIS